MALQRSIKLQPNKRNISPYAHLPLHFHDEPLNSSTGHIEHKTPDKIMKAIIHGIAVWEQQQSNPELCQHSLFFGSVLHCPMGS